MHKPHTDIMVRQVVFTGPRSPHAVRAAMQRRGALPSALRRAIVTRASARAAALVTRARAMAPPRKAELVARKEPTPSESDEEDEDGAFSTAPEPEKSVSVVPTDMRAALSQRLLQASREYAAFQGVSEPKQYLERVLQAAQAQNPAGVITQLEAADAAGWGGHLMVCALNRTRIGSGAWRVIMGCRLPPAWVVDAYTAMTPRRSSGVCFVQMWTMAVGREMGVPAHTIEGMTRFSMHAMRKRALLASRVRDEDALVSVAKLFCAYPPLLGALLLHPIMCTWSVAIIATHMRSDLLRRIYECRGVAPSTRDILCGVLAGRQVFLP